MTEDKFPIDPIGSIGPRGHSAFISGAPSTAVAGTSYSLTASLSGDQDPNPSFRWTVAGVVIGSFSPNSTYSWTPTTAQIGSSITVLVNISDSDGGIHFASASFTRTIAAPIPPPSTLVLPDPSSIDRTLGGNVYSTPLPAASGGTTPYAYSVTGRPSWLGFNASTRTFTGTESQTGFWVLVYRVTDNGSPQQSASQSFTYEVSAATPPQPQFVRHFYSKISGSWVTLKLHRKTNGSWNEVKLWRKVNSVWIQISGPI